MDDTRIVADAILKAEALLAAYIEPGPRDTEDTLNQLLATIDRNDVIGAAESIKRQSLS